MPDVWELVVTSTVLGHTCASCLKYQLNATGLTSLQAIADAFFAYWKLHQYVQWRQITPAGSVIKHLAFRRINNGGGPTYYNKPGTAGGGRGVADDSAMGPVLLASGWNGSKWVTARIFLPGYATVDVTNNAFRSSFLFLLKSRAASLVAPFNDGSSDWQSVIWDRAAKVGTPILGTAVCAKIGVQHRRLRRSRLS